MTHREKMIERAARDLWDKAEHDWDEEDDAALWREPLCLGCGAGETECLELGGCCTGCDHR